MLRKLVCDGYSFIPAAACYLVRDDKHHEVICGCVQIKQEVIGVKSKNVGRRHDVGTLGLIDFRSRT